ncbi:DUF3253 domain-containing protein [Methylolobus aquaticus]
MMQETLTCARCGRSMTPRRRWRDRPDTVRYCSDACRNRRLGKTDRALEAGILSLLEARSESATICPSEAVRVVYPELPGSELRRHMEASRQAARRLIAAGSLEMLQRGHVVDPSTTRGPVRLRLKRTPPEA